MTHIQMDQIYRACDPREDRRIRVTHYLPGDTHAAVCDADTGLRWRKVQVADLHPTDTTTSGAKRRTGYALEASR